MRGISWRGKDQEFTFLSGRLDTPIKHPSGKM